MSMVEGKDDVCNIEFITVMGTSRNKALKQGQQKNILVLQPGI